MKTGSLYSLLFLVLAAPVARAGIVTGRVVDQNGVGIAGVNIDVDNPNGSDPNISNAGTDAGGFFAMTVVPDGVFDIIFEPPAPPASTSLVMSLQGVDTAGTPSLGNVTLRAGVSLSGRLLSPTGSPLAAVNFDVIELATGQNLDLVADSTNALGLFQFAVPTGDIELRIDTSGLVGPTIAPDRVFLSPTGNTVLGDLTLEAGFVVSALVRRASNAVGVEEVDVDVIDTRTGVERYTPGDDTDAAGFVDFVVPVGTYDIEFCPPFSERLAAARLSDEAILSNRFLGTVNLPAGVVLSGSVQAFDGTLHAGIDVDLKHPSTGADLPICGDDTNASGVYSIVVPTGTWRVEFEPPYSLPLGSDVHPSVVVNADKALNGVLPSCPPYVVTAPGTPGKGGVVPALAALGGSARQGNRDYRFRITDGVGGGLAFLSISPPTKPPGGGPVFEATASRFVMLTLSGSPGSVGNGAATFRSPISTDPAFAGFTLTARCIVIDRAVPSGVALTNEIQATYCP